MGFPGSSAGKESACNVGDLDLIPGLGRSPEKANHYPLHYSGLENSMDYSMGSQSRTRLSDFHVHLTVLKNIQQLTKLFSRKLSFLIGLWHG